MNACWSSPGVPGERRGARRDLALFAAAYGAALLAIAFAFGWRHDCWVDECHFLRVIGDFASRGFTAIGDYNAGTPPLVFLLYAGWGKLFGFDPAVLRALSLLVALATGMSFHVLAREATGNRAAAFLLPFLLLANPYGAGLSFFVYTDMLMLLGILLAALWLLRGKPLLLGIACTAALLSRQYAVFLVAAAFLWALSRFARDRKPADAALAAAAGTSLLPLAALMVLWKGVAPPMALAPFAPGEALGFNPHNLVLYIALIPLYLAPVLLLRWRQYRFAWTTHAALALLSLAYWLAPVDPSLVAVTQMHRDTVGLAHRALAALLPGWGVHAVFLVCFAAGLHVLVPICRSIVAAVRTRTVDTPLFFDLAVLLFLVIMPFSYQTWEKYFLPLLPLLALRMTGCRNADPDR